MVILFVYMFVNLFSRLVLVGVDVFVAHTLVPCVFSRLVDVRIWYSIQQSPGTSESDVLPRRYQCSLRCSTWRERWQHRESMCEQHYMEEKNISKGKQKSYFNSFSVGLKTQRPQNHYVYRYNTLQIIVFCKRQPKTLKCLTILLLNFEL